MITISKMDDDFIMVVKGAPETIIAKCDASVDGGDFEAEVAIGAVESMATEGLKVITYATKVIT